MSDRPGAKATIVIERMPDVVRAQFFDLDHHVRDRLHHGMKLGFAPPRLGKTAMSEPPPGTSVRVRQETRVFGRSVMEEFVLEEDAAKRWVKRFIDGPNAGAKYVATFALDQGKATRVELEAFAPTGGFDNGLGKLSQLGVEKALQKILQEHKAALEGGAHGTGTAYEPGKARGDVELVLRSLRDLTTPLLAKPHDEQRAIVSNFMELAAVVAIADDEVDDVERQTMKGTARALCFVELDDATLDKLVASTRAAVEKEGADGRSDKIGSRLKRLGVEQLGLAVAVLIAQVSHGIDAREISVLQRVAHAAGVADADVAKLVARIDAMLSGPHGE